MKAPASLPDLFQSGLAHSLAGCVHAEADAYLLLDKDLALAACDQPVAGLLQLQSEFDGSNQAWCGWTNEAMCTEPGSSRPAEQQSSRNAAASAANSKGTTKTSGRKCTTLAQREAHKRYREKKKHNIAAMEAEVQTRRNELQQLQAENEALKSKARVLETAERCSVEIHELMKLLDGLQSLERCEGDATGGSSAGNDCCSSRPRSIASNMASDAGPVVATGGGSGGSSRQGSVVAIQAPGHGTPAAAAAATGVGATCSSNPGSGSHHSTFLNTLMHSSTNLPQQPVIEPSAAGTKQEAQESQQQTQPKLLSLRDEAHWLQLAQQYVDMQQQQPGSACGRPAQSSGVAVNAGACLKAAAATRCVAAEAAGGTAMCYTPSVSGMSPSSTAESGSSILADLGSVDTAEQGLVVYKAFLQKASELLALAQQQQLQTDLDAAAETEQQLSELTLSTISRLQPFLIARGQGVVYDWNARNLETQQPEEPPANLWPAVLDALQLTPDTQRDALNCFELFGAPLTRLLEERAELAQQYRKLQAHRVSPSSSGDDVVHSAAARTLEAVAEPVIYSMAALRALAANMERYQSLDGVFAHSLTNLLTGAQIAAACVASYPFLPRWHMLMATLKQHQEEGKLQQTQQQQGVVCSGADPSQQPQRRSSRIRTATKVAQEAVYS